MLRRLLGLVSYKEIQDFDKDKEWQRSINFEKSMEFVNDLSIKIDDINSEILNIKNIVFDEIDGIFGDESESDIRALKNVVYRLYQEYYTLDNVTRHKFNGRYKDYNLKLENPFDLTNKNIYERVISLIDYEKRSLKQLDSYKEALNNIMNDFSELGNHSSNNCYDLITDGLEDYLDNIETDHNELMDKLESIYIHEFENEERVGQLEDGIKDIVLSLENNFNVIMAYLNFSV